MDAKLIWQTLEDALILPNFVISGALILLAKISVAATVCQSFGVANYGTNQSGLWLHLIFLQGKVL
jgi:hypothetical protein